MTHMRQLFESFNIFVLESLRSRIRRSYAQAFCTGDRTNDRNMTAMMTCKIVECRIHHTCKSQNICLYCLHFYVDIQGGVLLTDTGCQKEQVYISGTADQFQQMLGSIDISDV